MPNRVMNFPTKVAFLKFSSTKKGSIYRLSLRDANNEVLAELPFNETKNKDESKTKTLEMQEEERIFSVSVTTRGHNSLDAISFLLCH